VRAPLEAAVRASSLACVVLAGRLDTFSLNWAQETAKTAARAAAI